MTENHPSFPGREGIPASLHQHIPEGWQPSPMPEDCQLPPATYATAEAYARFIAPGLHRPFMQMLGVGEAAIYDADQEVAMTLLENFRRRPLPDDISRKWLAAQVRNKAVDAIRATEREMGLIDWQDDDKEWFSNPVYDPETAVLSRLTIEEVDTLLDKLPATQAEILRLTFSDSSLRAQDIGELVGSSAGVVRVNQGRALQRLRALIEAAGLPMEQPLRHQSPPSPPLADIRRKVTTGLLKSRAPGAPEQTLAIPLYIGPWRIAAAAMRSYLSNDQQAGSILVVHPRQDDLPLLGKLLRRVAAKASSVEAALSSERTPQLIIDTPENVVRYPEAAGLPISYITAAEETIPCLAPELRRRANFLLRVAGGVLPRSAAADYRASTYKKAGDKRIIWSEDDSLAFVQEWTLQTGKPPTEEEITALSTKGEGPPLRRVCRGIGDLSVVLARAGWGEVQS